MPWSSVSPYVVLVVGIPAATVVAGLVTFWIALADPVAMAMEPVVKQGLAVIQPQNASAEPADTSRP